MHGKKPTKSKTKGPRQDKHWKDLRKLLSGDEAICQICGIVHREKYKIGPNKGKYKRRVKIQFDLHHKHYRNLGSEKVEDLMVLCQVCHEFGHKTERMARTRGFDDLYATWKVLTGWEFEKRRS